MSIPNAVWLSTSSSLQCLAQPLLNCLTQVGVRLWQYEQQQDGECSLEAARLALHDYLNPLCQPIHLIGHSIGGLLGLLYTQQYPETVKSLTLL
jgi:pimeloyl-ACP methyl ester carboxylesterase